MLRNSTILFSFLLTFLATSGLYAQGWERSYGNEENESFSDVLPTPDGGYLAVGYQGYTTSADIDVRLVKTDADGQETWSQLLGAGTHSEFGKSIATTSDGGYVIGGTAEFDGFLYGFVLKTDALGNEEWLTYTSRDSIEGRKAIELADGSFALVGSEIVPSSLPNPDTPNKEIMLMKVDSGGVEQWIENYGGEAYEEGFAVEEVANGFLMVGITTSFGAGHYDVIVYRASGSGAELWHQTHGSVHAELAFDMAACADGNFVITGQSEELTPESENVFLLKINTSGQELWWQTYEKSGLETANFVEQTSDGGFVIAGNVRADEDADRNVFLLKVDEDGLEEWSKEFGGNKGDGASAVREAPNAGYILAGFTRSYGSGGSDGYLVRTDFSGVSNSCFIIGNVHSNMNSDCNTLSAGQPIGGYIVEVAGVSGVTYFGTSDVSGNYLVPVEEGQYNVRLVNPSPYWEICYDSVDVTVLGNFDTAYVDFTLKTEIACPLMEVDMTTLGLRRCFPGTYTINYKNLGTIVANPGLVDVTFDEYLIIDSASVPWVSQVGDTYTFNVGDLWPFESGTFDVFFTVDCDSTVLGQTHCSEAVIHPDTICLPPSPTWDGSSIEVNAVCEGDSISFSIKNVSDEDMAGVLDFIIIEDHIIGLQGTFTLDGLQDTTFKMPSSGSTFRFEADQSEGHPGNSKPSVSVEGCGGTPYSTGYVIQYPLNDADLSVDTDCRENIGSFDPNDKQGFPLGYSVEHYITKDTEIEYLIRFQNTGTDTAFTVVIRDTLSPFLNPTSIMPGASSHDYRFELYGTGVVKFTFDDIMLPDSNINEPASHGFVKFRIAQRVGNSNGTLIENSAGIYFDFNEPVITNTTFHTIGENFVKVDSVSSVSNPYLEPVPSVKVYPNPFTEKALFELENVQSRNFTFSLFDVTGREVKREDFEKTNYQFERSGLAAGIYFFRIESRGEFIASGRVVLR